jgi:haloacetate dehalogenase
LLGDAAVVTDLADLFPGFASEFVDTGSGRIFVRTGGKGPPLLVLHGYPQTHAMWHRVAPDLAERFSLVIADLPGYGSSDAPAGDRVHKPYTKRAMAVTMIEAMKRLGHSRFSLAGHDRGGRVAYRMALDHPELLTKVAVLDILPTYDYWANLSRPSALRIYHWTFLAQPYPMPENLISADPDRYFGPTFNEKFDPRAIQHYLTALRQPARIHAMCEDYRAGAYDDFEHDKANFDEGTKISIPLHVIWGSRGVASGVTKPMQSWQRWATAVTGEEVEAGHFMCEENPKATSAAILRFMLKP